MPWLFLNSGAASIWVQMSFEVMVFEWLLSISPGRGQLGSQYPAQQLYRCLIQRKISYSSSTTGTSQVQIPEIVKLETFNEEANRQAKPQTQLSIRWGILIFRRGSRRKEAHTSFLSPQGGLDLKSPLLSGWPVPTAGPSFQGPSDDFPCFSDGCRVLSLLPQVFRSRFKNERYTSLDVLQLHCSRGAIVIVTTQSSLLSDHHTWFLLRAVSGRKEGSATLRIQSREETCYPCCAFFKTWPRQHNHGAQKWPLTRNTRRWNWGKVSCLFSLNLILFFSKEKMFSLVTRQPNQKLAILDPIRPWWISLWCVSKLVWPWVVYGCLIWNC